MNWEAEKQLGERIRRFREGRKLTQEQFSAKLQLCGCDLTRSAVAKIEAGQRHLYVDELHCIAKVLAVSYSELLD